MGLVDCLSIAKDAFARTKYVASCRDVFALAKNMVLVERAGLGQLNQRLRNARTKIFDTIAEINLAAALMRHLKDKATINYELNGFGNRPVDFAIQLGAVTFWLQMKRFANLQRENRRDQMLRTIAQRALLIPTTKFFDCALSETFVETDIPALEVHLATIAPASVDGQHYDFLLGELKARTEFWLPGSTKLKGLTLGSAGDLRPVDIAGLAADQVRGSLRNAVGAFSQPLSSTQINLLVAEADKYEDIDVGDACFGTETELLHVGAPPGWTREPNGVFREVELRDKVAGLLVMRRTDKSKPVCEYDTLLFVNEPYSHLVPSVQELLPIRFVARYNMRPEQGHYC